jgi:hypothetical protein
MPRKLLIRMKTTKPHYNILTIKAKKHIMDVIIPKTAKVIDSDELDNM